MEKAKKEIYQALSNNASLTALLKAGVIYGKLKTGFNSYPALVYDVISKAPLLFSDNALNNSKITVQVSILQDTENAEIYHLANKIMLELGYLNDYETLFSDDENIIIKTVRYTKIF